MLILIAFFVTFCLSMFQSMKSISYISMVAMVSIFVALGYILVDDMVEMAHPRFDKNLQWIDFSGLPYFFGTAMFMFEGNAVALEIYY